MASVVCLSVAQDKHEFFFIANIIIVGIYLSAPWARYYFNHDLIDS